LLLDPIVVEISGPIFTILCYEPNRDDSEALFWSLVYPQDQEKSYRKFNGLAIGKTNQFHENFRVKHRDGHFFISIPLVLL
jgi:hypothetical protein